MTGECLLVAFAPDRATGNDDDDSRHLTILGSYYCKKKQIYVRFLCLCPLIGDEFRQNIVKVYCGAARGCIATFTML